MRITRASLSTCSLATDTVVVIDVLRAFTTAAYAFAAGVKDIFPVSTVDEAFTLKQANKDYLLMGETAGLPIEGFNFSNSPSELIGKDLTGLTLVQRTSTGTQGVVRSTGAKRLLVTAFCNASATVQYLKLFDVKELCLVETGTENSDSGLDDIACADLLEALLLGKDIEPAQYIDRVRRAPASHKFLDQRLDAFPTADLDCASRLDQFDFAMEVSRQEGHHVLTKVLL